MRNSGLCCLMLAGLLSAPAAPAVATPPPDPDAALEPPRQLRLAPEPGGVAAVDVPVERRLSAGAGGRYRSARMDAAPFSMVGLTWSPSADRRGERPQLRVRVHSADGWRSWQDAEPVAGASGTELLWVGRSDKVQVESRQRRVPGLALTLIQPQRVARPPARPAPARSERPSRPDRAPRPKLHSRVEWGADNRLRDGKPRYNRTIQQVHVHHTVSSNSYKRGDVPGMIRGMYRYHTQNLGWSDLGYNFLVDKFGRIWVGRAGGALKPVRGAHTLGFNATSVGVALIGNYETAWPWKKARTAVVQLAAWKLDKYGRKPGGHAKVYSRGSDRFPAGRMVRLPVIDGHRDTNLTACPGRHVYDKLPNIRRRAAERAKRFS